MISSRALPAGSEVAVLGLGKSGVAAAMLLVDRGYSVYASDSADTLTARENAAALDAMGVAVDCGHHDLDRLARAALVVASPGIPPDAAALVAARNSGREVISEIEIAIRLAPELRYIAVTGTNGKTTTTALIGHILRALGANASDAGNIGTPLSEFALGSKRPDWIALELSSFQLHDTPSIDPQVGVLTNLAPDHLDRYATVTDYYADKALLFANAGEQSRWVFNGDDQSSIEMIQNVRGAHFAFSVQQRSDAWLDRAAGELVVLGRSLMRRDELALLGDHNVANALAASLAVMVADSAFATDDARAMIGAALRKFRALAHRLEVVGEWNGIQWINDSKATNIASTLVAVDGMTRPTILLLGGRHKGEPYTALAGPIGRHVKRVIAYGESASIVQDDLAGTVPVDRIEGSFEDVMSAARGAAEGGDAVLLSPACSSYDMFRNYVERGERFRALARENAGDLAARA